MLDIRLIRENPEFFIERLKVRGIDAGEKINQLLSLYDDLASEKKAIENLQAEINKFQKEVNPLRVELNKLNAKGESAWNTDEQSRFGNISKEMTALNEKISNANTQLSAKEVAGAERRSVKTLESEIQTLILTLPNLPSSKVPAGKSAEDNEVVRMGGSRPELHKNAVPHWDLAKKYDLIDFELGNKITGSGFPVYKGRGARLQRSLIQYFLDYNTREGYTEFQPPHMVNEDSAYGTGQLPDKEGQMYHVTADDLYLIPTAEVPITNIYRDVMVKEAELPVKMTAYTPCFRREAGSYGKDVRGLNRLHQFDKVEIVQLVHPEKSYEVLEEMVAHVERLIQSLGLHYRILRLCGGDMGFTSALTYDFEVYSAAQEKWLEVSSVSNFETFQSNRMKIRFKDSKNKSQLVHTLNGSSLALPRILACILENNQNENGILLPVPLQGYFGSETI